MYPPACSDTKILKVGTPTVRLFHALFIDSKNDRVYVEDPEKSF